MSFSDEQVRNARIIYQVGQQLGASLRDIQIAIMAALVESNLRNVNYGDRDSLGLFQQRSAWGTREQRTDPAQAARMFFTGGHAGQRGLFDFANRDNMSMGEAAQAVQVSAYPDRYASMEDAASGILSSMGHSPLTFPAGVHDTSGQGGTTLGGVVGMDALNDAAKQDSSVFQLPDPPSVTEVNGLGEITADEAGIGEMNFSTGDGSSPLDTPKFGQPTYDQMSHLKMPTLDELGINLDSHTTTSTSYDGTTSGGNSGVVGFAKKFLGTPYVWGGTTPTGFDCSGFTQYVMAHFGVHIPRVSADQGRSGKAVGRDGMKPGDLVFWDNSSRNVGADHVGIYIGNGLYIAAPRPGGAVEIGHLYGDYWARRVL